MSMVFALSVIIAVISLGALLAAHYIVKETRDIILSLEHQVTVQNLFEKQKPDAAKECGVVKPFFSDNSPLFRKTEIKAEAKGQPMRMGKHKVRIYLYDVPEPLLFHNLAEFYRFAEVRKCDFSPSTKMEEDVRLSMIAASIVKFYRERGLTVRAVSLYRKKRWHAFEYDEKGFRK